MGDKEYKYGMISRGYSPGAQPPGVIGWEDVDKTKTGYWSIITYGRELSDIEVENYDLNPISVVELYEIGGRRIGKEQLLLRKAIQAILAQNKSDVDKAEEIARLVENMMKKRGDKVE